LGAERMGEDWIMSWSGRQTDCSSEMRRDQTQTELWREEGAQPAGGGRHGNQDGVGEVEEDSEAERKGGRRRNIGDACGRGRVVP
jgi:hypothetical protein